jgi:IS5 family transposase
MRHEFEIKQLPNSNEGTRRLKRALKRRNAIEAVIVYLKNVGLLGRNYLKGEMGDALHAILCGAGHNIRLILRRLRFFGLIFGDYCLDLECLPQSNNSCWQHKTEYL